MNDPQRDPPAACGFAATRQLLLTEVALVFAVFFIQGSMPVPEVNEPYYLGKAINFWNPDWVRGDFFLQSKDTHTVFYFTFGWLSLWLSPTVLAWVGRLLTWGLLAWAWQRLSFAVIPKRWYSVLTASLLVFLVEHFHMAGEWIIGGVEAKGFAFVLVFLGLEALVRDRWSRAWLLLGAASAFHVLVGGWSVAAAAIAWVLLGKDRPALRSMWPAIVGGFLLSLPGLIPALLLNWGTDAETVRLANQLYVFDRLPHHLTHRAFPFIFLFRFASLLALWMVLVSCRVMPLSAAMRRLRAFVGAAVLIAAVGMAISLLAYLDPVAAAGLLRFYWFRLADVAVPLGVSIALVSFVVAQLDRHPLSGKICLAITTAVAGVYIGNCALQRPFPVPAPADRLPHYEAWYDACDWVANSGDVAPDARFITPRMSQTFKWYTGRAEVVNWKEVPQDAHSIVQWWRMLEDLYSTGLPAPEEPWHVSLAKQGTRRLKRLGTQYDADYLITVAKPPLDLEIAYGNRYYRVYRLEGDKVTDRVALASRPTLCYHSFVVSHTAVGFFTPSRHAHSTSCRLRHGRPDVQYRRRLHPGGHRVAAPAWLRVQ